MAGLLMRKKVFKFLLSIKYLYIFLIISDIKKQLKITFFGQNIYIKMLCIRKYLYLRKST
jgi:hypothetical protein